jgi:TrmH family RNA methyltransferase
LQRRAARREAGLFLAEGRQAVSSGLAAHAVTELFCSQEALDRDTDLVTAARDSGLPVRVCEDAAVASLSETVTPQGLVALARMPASTDLDVLSGLVDDASRQPLLLAVLDNARDPGNAGTVIRAADAAGADAVVLTAGSVDPWNGKCVRSTAGSIFHLPIIVGASLDEVASRLAAGGCRMIAADGEAGRGLEEALATGELAASTAWIFGNEAHGLPPAALKIADDALRVPIRGRAESLNLAGAATVCLYASAWAQAGWGREGRMLETSTPRPGGSASRPER